MKRGSATTADSTRATSPHRPGEDTATQLDAATRAGLHRELAYQHHADPPRLAAMLAALRAVATARGEGE
jgi:hypothetical protein